MQHDHFVAALGLVEVGRAQQHTHALGSRPGGTTIAHSSRRETGSTPTVGSSSSSSCGARTSVQARPSFCFMPPESRPARRAGTARARSSACSSAIARAARSRARHALQVGVQVEVLLDAQVFVEAEALRHVAERDLHAQRCGAGASSPSTGMRPRVGREQPATRRMSVVLPAPSGPISPVTSPARAQAHAPQRLHSRAPARKRLLTPVSSRTTVSASAVVLAWRSEVADAHGLLLQGSGLRRASRRHPAATSTVAGMPSRSSSCGAQTNTRTW